MTRRPARVELDVMKAVRSADWLDPRGVDQAAVRAARVLAAEIDDLTRPAPSLFDLEPLPAAPEVAGKVGYLVNTLAAVLAQLGLTPAGRANIGLSDRSGDDATVAEIRAIRTGPQGAAGDFTGDMGT